MYDFAEDLHHSFVNQYTVQTEPIEAASPPRDTASDSAASSRTADTENRLEHPATLHNIFINPHYHESIVKGGDMPSACAPEGPIARTRRFKKRLHLAFKRVRWPILSEAELLLIRADKRTRNRLVSMQLLPIIILMLVPLGFFVFTSNKAILMVMILLLLTVYVPLVSLVGLYFTVKLDSYHVNLRREYVRLRQARSADLEAVYASGPATAKKPDIVQRMRERRLHRPRLVAKKPPRQIARSKYAR